MAYRPESTYYKSHFFAATFVSFWLTLCQANAQSRETAFGQIRNTPVPGKFDRFALSARPGETPILFLWSRGGLVTSSAALDSSGALHDWKEHYLKTPTDEFMVVDFAFERKRIGVGIGRAERRISFYTSLSADTLRPSTALQLPLTPAGIVFGDLNNDRRTDFIVFDRESPGAIPFFGVGNERFRQGKPLAPDNAIEALQLVHLNNDSLLDIVFYDWVRSEVHLLYGIGQGKFLDQASISVDGEVRDLAVTSLAPHGNLDIALSCQRPAKVEILQGDGLGDFKLEHRISLKEPFISFDIDDVNDDGYKDIVGLDASSVLHTFLNGGDGTFDDRLDFVSGRDVGQFVLYEGARQGQRDAVLLDRATQSVVALSNGQGPTRFVDSVDYTTGVHPRGIVVGDVDGDGINDVVLVTGGSNSLSIYYNRKESGILGQICYTLPSSAYYLAFHSLRDSTARFLISYPNSKQASLFALDERERAATNATIGTERAVEFLYWDGVRKPAIDFFCFSPLVSTTGASLALFQEIESHQFIEQSFRLSASNTLLGAGVGLLNEDPFPDVAYVYRNNPTGKHEMAVSLGDSLYSYKQKSYVVELPEKSISRSYVWVIDLDQDGRSDILMLHAGPTPLLERVRQLRGNTYSRPDTVAMDAKINDWSQVQFADLDGDGKVDIVLNDAGKGGIGWLRGAGNSFEQFRLLCAVPRTSHFSLGDLNGDRTPDIAVTLGELGVLRVYDGKSLLRRSRETNH